MQKQAALSRKKIAGENEKRAALTAALVFPITFVIAFTELFGRPTPFSASLCGALSGAQCIAAFAGNAAGSFFSGNYEHLVSSVSSMLAVMTVRLILSRFKSRAAEYFSILTVAFSVFASNCMYASSVSELLSCIMLAFFSGGLTYAVFRVKDVLADLPSAGSRVKNDPVTAAAIISVLAASAYVASGFTIGVFNIGIIASVTLSLAVLMRYSAAAGTVCAAACSLGIAAMGETSWYSAVLVAAAAVGSAFISGGKYKISGAYIFASAVCASLFTMDDIGLALMADIMAGGALFMLIPEKVTDSDNAIYAKNEEENSIRRIFSRRMMFAKGAVGEVRRAVELTAEKLDGETEYSDSSIYDAACDEICRKCRYNMVCWGNEYNDTVKVFSKAVKAIKKGETPDMSSFGEAAKRCEHKKELCEKMLSLHKLRLAKEAERHRVRQLRSVLTMQLSATEDLIEKLCNNDFLLDGYDARLSEAARGVLEADSGVQLDAVGVAVGKKGRVSVEAYSRDGFAYGKEELANAMSLAMHRQFDLPSVTKNNGCYKLTMFSKTTYCLDVEICQISKDESKVCGDYFESFVDNSGSAYVILSDGMGSGSRARIDSAFACGMLVKLLRAGVGIEAGISIINLSLMVKSSDESFATLEICKVDLYSGVVEIYKAGSANTYIKCGGSMAKSPCKGLPIGINDKVSYEKQTFRLGSGDMIVMTSDGARLNDKWLFREMNKNPAALDEFSKNIAETAKFYCGDNERDDISVIAMKLHK